MDNTTLILIGLGVLVVVIAAVAFFAVSRKRQEKHLQSTFGNEYDTTYATAVDRKAAKQDLKAREERVASYELKPIPAEQRMSFLSQWQGMQASFVDDPGGAIKHADGLLSDVMTARGYPARNANEEDRIGDVSVGHGDEATAYREAARVAALNRDGRATTEELRRAIKDYGVVFESLLNEKQPVG